MTEVHPEAAAILQTLAASLPGEYLARSFPDHTGQEIRHILTATAQALKGRQGATPDPPPLPHRAAPPSPATASGPLTLFTDGASRGNPGLAGAGIQLLDSGRHEILAAAKFLGHCTNNEAEYLALLFGLQEARRLGSKEITVCLDSELVVRQLNGVYQVKNARLQGLFAQVKKELKHFARHQIRHIPRAQNQRADELANQGIDERETGR